jgi:DNA polymerase III subunit gamma/tau
MSEQYQVSARKYRPMRFEDVVGQEHIAGTLKSAMTQGKVAHAFLFCGPRGVGKTTCARILASTLNCLAPQNNEPCGSCSSCAAFRNGQSFNIVELDAASNNSVEHIRSLTEQVRFAPQSGKYKVFIIDEVHMLTASAFNAFLKTLEEPPPYAIFILATTEKHKILPTILSRCQIFDFKRISVLGAVNHLKHICEKEGIKAEPEALHVIGQKADGALRDALSIFDRVANSANGILTYAHVIEQLNVLDADYFFQLTDLLLAEDHAGVLTLFDEVLTKGFDAELFINGLSEHLRNVLICRDARTAYLLEAGEGTQQRYTQQASIAPESFLLSALSLLNECEINLRMARNRRLHTELYLLKIAYIGKALNWGNQPQVETKFEKKTESVNLVAQKTSPMPSASLVVPIQPEIVVPVELKSIETEQPSSHVVQEPAGQRSSLRKPDASIRLSMASFEEAVKLETSANAEKVSRFSAENVQTSWNEYAALVESAILRTNMQQAILHADLNAIRIVATTHNGTAREMITQEGALLTHLRSQLHEPLMLLSVEVDPALAEAAKVKAPAKALTERDKYIQMTEVNQSLSLLTETFGLEMGD